MGGMMGGGMGGGTFSNIMQLFMPVNHALVGEVEPVIGLTGQIGGQGLGAGVGGGRGVGGGQYGGGGGRFAGGPGGQSGGGQYGGGQSGGGQYGTSATAPGNIEIILILRSIVPDIIEPYTGDVLSYIDFSPTTNLLIIHNTPSNFQLIERMIENLDLTPRQVAIEAKFLTVEVRDLDKTGISWGGQISDVDRRPRRLVGDDGTPIDATYSGLVGYDNDGTAATADIPYQLNPDGSSRLNQTFSSGVMDMANALVSGVGEGNFAVTALLKKNEDGDFIQATIEYLSSLEHSELLSAPKVVALNRKPAMFADVETEYFDSYRSTQLVGGGVSYGGAQGFGVIETVQPTMWIFGITLSATAQIGKGDQIRLWLNPQVIDRIGEKKFISTTTLPQEGGQPVTTTSTTTLPTTDVKAVWSNVIVHDGDTVVLGGMVEDVQREITEKLPLLADIPILGRLFRGEGRSVRQRNLLIFVTPTIIDTTGAKFFRGE